MSNANRTFRSLLSPAGRFFGNAAASIRFAAEADRLAKLPDHVFIARGTTRQDAIRELLDGL